MKKFTIWTKDDVEHIVIATSNEEAVEKITETGTYTLEDVMFVSIGEEYEE